MSLTRNEHTGTWPSRNVQNIRHSLRGTLLAYVLLWTSGLPEDSRRKLANGCSILSKLCPRTQGFVCKKEELVICVKAKMRHGRARRKEIQHVAFQPRCILDLTGLVGCRRRVFDLQGTGRLDCGRLLSGIRCLRGRPPPDWTLRVGGARSSTS